ANFDEVLPRHLERGFDGLRAAAHEVRVADAWRRGADELLGQRLGRLRGKETRMRGREAVDLRVHRREDVGMAVAEARHRGAAGRVEILFAAGVDQPGAVAADGNGRGRTKLAVKDAAHRERRRRRCTIRRRAIWYPRCYDQRTRGGGGDMATDSATARRAGVTAVHSLDHFVFSVPDLDTAARFYDDFGLEVQRRDDRLHLHTIGHSHRWGTVLRGGAAKRLQYLAFGAFPEDM